MTLDDLERQNRGFYGFFRDIRLRKSISFTRRRHRRQRHTRLWPKCTMVPMGRVQMICDFRDYNYWNGNAIGFRASRELCSNFLFKQMLQHFFYRIPTDTTNYGRGNYGWSKCEFRFKIFLKWGLSALNITFLDQHFWIKRRCLDNFLTAGNLQWSIFFFYFAITPLSCM